MLTKDDLLAFGELLKTERAHTRKIIREELAFNNQLLGTIIKVELGETNKYIEELTASTKETAKQVKNHTDQIEELQENAGLKPHKN